MLEGLGLYFVYYVLHTEIHLDKWACETYGPKEREEILDQLKIKKSLLISCWGECKK